MSKAIILAVIGFVISLVLVNIFIQSNLTCSQNDTTSTDFWTPGKCIMLFPMLRTLGYGIPVIIGIVGYIIGSSFDSNDGRQGM